MVGPGQGGESGAAASPAGCLFAQLMAERQLTDGDVAIECGVEAPSARDWRLGVSWPRERHAPALARLFGLDGCERIYRARAADKAARREGRSVKRALLGAAAALRAWGKPWAERAAQIERWAAEGPGNAEDRAA